MADTLALGARLSAPALPATGTPRVSQTDLLQLFASRALQDALALLHAPDVTADQLWEAVNKAARAKSVIKRMHKLMLDPDAESIVQHGSAA